MASLPLIDVAPLVAGEDDLAVAEALDRACREVGFLYVVGHGVDPALQARLEHAAERFFALGEPAKAAVSMARGGRAWRGWFPLRGELTSGRPDDKEGIYFGAELSPDDPRVVAGVPMHGANLVPDEVPELGPAVVDWVAALTTLGQHLLRGLALALGLPGSWFARHLTADPLVLFRIFRYPPAPPAPPAAPAAGEGPGWGVAEHTDYGLLTILLQDAAGGLEVRAPSGWVEAPPVEGSFVVNLGDMLERLTGGRYRSTAHRVRNVGDRDRLSYPFFLDPGWDVEVQPLPLDVTGPAGPPPTRWDGADLGAVAGTYGDYLLGKVARAFPQLGDAHLD
jgi:isopenicillin N synthase-like dioxygenase